MTSIRLTNALRDTIVAKLLARKYAPEIAARKIEGDRLFNALLDAMLGPHKAAVESLPTAWTMQRLEVNINHDEVGTRFYLRGLYARRLPSSGFSTWVDIGKMTIEPDFDEEPEEGQEGVFLAAPKKIKKKLEADIVAYGKRERELEKEKNAYECEIRGVLSNVTTVKRLYEAWPELKPLLKWSEHEPLAGGTAIAVNLDKLNTAFELPPKEEANV